MLDNIFTLLLFCVFLSSVRSFSFRAKFSHSPGFEPFLSTEEPTKALRKSSALYFFKFGESKEKAAEGGEAENLETAQQNEEFKDGAYDADDPVEKMFSFFFGKRELNPMGMKRFGRDRFPEQYPATKTEFAEPVVGDSKEVALLRPFLKNTSLEKRALRLAYDANRDGWSALNFHRAVDKKGPSVVVCTTESGLICGGYNPKGWVGYGVSLFFFCPSCWIVIRTLYTQHSIICLAISSSGGARFDSSLFVHCRREIQCGGCPWDKIAKDRRGIFGTNGHA